METIDKEVVIPCQCSQREHSLYFTIWDWGKDGVDFEAQVLLNHYKGFFARIWSAVKYVFKIGQHDVHFDATLISKDNAIKLRNLLNEYINDERAE